MSDTNTDTNSGAAEAADEAMARFEARMADNKAHDERNRPERDREQTIEAAMANIKGQIEVEERRLEAGGFKMASQELAQQETIRDLRWLLEDVSKLRAGS